MTRRPVPLSDQVIEELHELAELEEIERLLDSGRDFERALDLLENFESRQRSREAERRGRGNRPARLGP